jgi:hypothetical protein
MVDITPTLNMIDDALNHDRGQRPGRVLFEKLSSDVANGAVHLEPILAAIRDHGVEISFIHLDEDIMPADGIAVLKDGVSQEAVVSRYPTLDQYLKTGCGAFLIHGQPATLSYLCAAFDAAYLRRNVLIVETHLSRVSKWRDIVLAANPNLALMIEMPETHGSLH